MARYFLIHHDQLSLNQRKAACHEILADDADQIRKSLDDNPRLEKELGQACLHISGLVEHLEKALLRIEELKLVDLGALRDAENWGHSERIAKAKSELEQTKDFINTSKEALAASEEFLS